MKQAKTSRADLQAQLEETDRKFGKESLYYFAKHILGYDALRPKPHKEVCAFAERVVKVSKRGLDLEPRGAFKTTIFSQALPAWLILQNPNVRILLDSAVLQNSIDNLTVVKNLLTSEYFTYLYGDHSSPSWTMEAITVGKRTNPKLKEPTVRVASPERIQTGPHYDVIIADDLVTDLNVTTVEQRKKIIDHIKGLFSLLDPGGVLILIGTRWHDEDAYGLILTEYADFEKRVRAACKLPEFTDLYFPERLTKEFLQEQKNHLGRDHFASQYLNDPAPEDADAKFQAVWFKRFKSLEEKHYSFITIDPGGEKKGSDDWVFLGAHQGASLKFYLDKLVNGKFKVAQAWDVLFTMADQLPGLVSVGLETTGGQKFLLESLQDEMRRRGRFLNIVPLAHAGDSKEFRILRLQPLYQCGQVYHSADMEPLEKQLRRFPKGADDVADAAAMVPEIAVAPRSAKSKESHPKNFDEMVWREVMGQNKPGRRVHSILGSEA